MEQPRYLGWYVLLLLISQVVLVSSRHLFKGQELDSFLRKRQTEIQGQYAMLVQLYRQRIQAGYARDLAAPEILTLLTRPLSRPGGDRSPRLHSAESSDGQFPG